MGKHVPDPTPETAPGALPGALTGSILGGFKLISLLGAGGMAEVYRGYDPQLHREVAVKVLTGDVSRDPQYVARFRSEAQRVAALSHPNIVPVFHFGEERNLCYLVMPVLKESLRDRIVREGALDPVEAVALAVEVAEALDVTHRHGLVHRDVKPENILLNDEGRPLLSDFGIAQHVEVLRDATVARTLSATGLPIGTPEYMAPEQLRGAAADQRVDVYGLGAVLYELLTGRVPHEGATPYDVAARALTEAPLSPAKYNPALWPALANVILGAVASNPDQRYPDMSRLVEALRRAVVTRDDASVSSAPNTNSRTSAVGEGGPRRADALLMGDLGDLGDLGDRIRRRTAGPLESYGAFGDIAQWPNAHTMPPRQRHRVQRLVAIVATVLVLALVLALGAIGAGRVLLAPNVTTPRTTGNVSATVTTLRTSSPPISGATATLEAARTPTATHVGGGMPTAAPTALSTISTPTTAPLPTTTPLRTPTMVTSNSPLAFQPYPSATNAKNCVATQKLTNVSAVDAQWTWTNAPASSGWQYNFTGLSSTTWQAFPATLSKTTAANSSDYVYIKAGLDSTTTGGYCTKLSTVATISVAGGSGTKFSVSY